MKCWKESIDIISSSSKNDQSLVSSSAVQTLQESKDTFNKISDSKNDKNTSLCMSMDVFRAIQIILQKENKLAMLEEALSSKTSSLVFATPSSAESKDQEQKDIKFHKRMERLRLRNEETKYHKLTNNLQDHRNEDDITAKSMTFAASVGLNMIIAPLSFGCFMYFFAGGVLDWFFPKTFDDTKRNNGGTDIKRVIIGVISGVIMMIIEMILFVIRTHEFEKHSTQKKRKKGIEPFGAYSSKTTPAIYSDNSTQNSE